MRLENYLNELFDTKVETKKKKDTDKKFEYQFMVTSDSTGPFAEVLDPATYLFTFAAHKSKYGGVDRWEVIFFRHTSKGSKLDALGDFSGKAAIEVFSAVKSLFTKWFKKNTPEEFIFGAKDTEISRMAIYKKFAKQISKITGYAHDEIIDDGQLLFVFERPD